MTRDNSHDDSDGTADRTGVTRRRLVATGATAWASVSVAGCSRIDDPNDPIFGDDGDDGSDGSDGGDGGDGDDGGTGGPTVTNETTATGGDGGDGGTEPTPTSTGTSCGSLGNFASGMDVGLHVNVYDSDTGEPLDANSLDSVTVEFPDADIESKELSWYGDHEVYDPESWGSRIEDTEDLDPGTYRYEITVEGDEALDEPETVVDEFTIV